MCLNKVISLSLSFHCHSTFYSTFGIILRAMVSENVKYGVVRVVPRISLRKLHNLLRFAIHFINI